MLLTCGLCVFGMIHPRGIKPTIVKTGKRRAQGRSGEGRPGLERGLQVGSRSWARSSRSECSPHGTDSQGWPAPQGAPGCSWRPRWSANGLAKWSGGSTTGAGGLLKDKSEGLGTYFNGLLQVVFDVLHFGGLLTTVELKRKKKIILHPAH